MACAASRRNLQESTVSFVLYIFSQVSRLLSIFKLLRGHRIPSCR